MSIDAQSYASLSMENLWSHAEKGDLDVSIHLLRGLGYSAAAVDIALDPNSYYFPNVRGSGISRPRGIGNDKIPVMSLEPSTTYRFEAPVLHDEQVSSLRDLGLNPEEYEAIFSRSDPVIETSGGSAEAAVVYRRLATEAGWIKSRPALIFNNETQRRDQSSYICASVALHETVHIAENLTNPLWNPENALQKELEAFAVQAGLAGSYLIPYSKNVQIAAAVDQFRKKYLGESTFEPDEFYLTEAAYHPETAALITSVARRKVGETSAHSPTQIAS